MYEIDKDLKGEPFLFEGVKLNKKEILKHLNTLVEVVAFYADAETYHAIAFLPDPPCGEFMEDFSDNDDYDYPKPGKLARETFEYLYKEILNRLTKE